MSLVHPGECKVKVTVCGQLKLFNFEYENVKFLVEIFNPNHPKIVGIPEISILTICIHQAILTGGNYLLLVQCHG